MGLLVDGAGALGFGAAIAGLMGVGMGEVRGTSCGGDTTAFRPAHPINPAAKAQASRGMTRERRIERAEQQEE
jgi:hypothetical protein